MKNLLPHYNFCIPTTSIRTLHPLPLLQLLDFLLQILQTDLILNHQILLQLLDAEANIDERGVAPHEAVMLYGQNGGLERRHVGVGIPGLDVECYDGFGCGFGGGRWGGHVWGG